MRFMPFREHSPMPRPIQLAPLEYTDEARQASIEGNIELAFELASDGIAHNIQVVRGLGFGLNEKAVDCLRGWIFSPQRNPDGTPTTISTSVVFVFRL